VNKRMLYLLLFLVVFSIGTHMLLAQESSPAALQAADTSSSGAAAAVIIAQFLTSVKVSGFASWGIKLLKDSQSKALSWIGPNTPMVSKGVSLVTAALTAGGVSYVWTPANHSLLFTNLSLVGIGGAVWHTAQNYLIQKGWYKTTFGGGASDVAVQPGGVAIAPAVASAAKKA
jgi:hypothetical protein